MNIHRIEAYSILDSRGHPTVEVELTLTDGTRGRGLVPSGASTGRFEALELRDNDMSYYGGLGVNSAIDNVNKEIAPVMSGLPADDQRAVDERLIELDGTPNKSRLGANALLGVSMAVADAVANRQQRPLYDSLGDGKGTLIPLPEIQIIGGGAHADWATDVQDYLVIAVGAKSWAEVLEMTWRVYRAAGEVLTKMGKRLGVADEGGYWPSFDTNEQPLQILLDAIEAAGLEPGRDVAISLDIAASDLYDEKTRTYHFRLGDRRFGPDEFIDYLVDWCRSYPVLSLEDPLADVDHHGWKKLVAEVGGEIQIVGDDLFTTNLQRIETGISDGLANSVLIKLNQIGTVTETMDAVRRTQQAGWLPVISARSGETEDAFVSHLAVATNAGQIKVGSMTRSERTVKWNEITRIARHLGERADFVGEAVFDRIVRRRASRPI